MYLEDNPLSALRRAINCVLLNRRNQRTLPRIIALIQKVEEISEIGVCNMPWSVLPRCLGHLGSGATGHCLLLLLLLLQRRSKRQRSRNRIDVSVSVSRDVRATAITAVRVHVSVEVSVLHF